MVVQLPSPRPPPPRRDRRAIAITTAVPATGIEDEMSEINNAKTTIADKIHAAVSSLLETEMRLNADLMEARDIAREQKAEIHRLQEQLAREQHARQQAEQIVSRVAELTGTK